MTRPKKPDGTRLAPVIPLAPRLLRKGVSAIAMRPSELDAIELSERLGGDYTVLTVRGEVDILTVPALNEWLSEVVRAQATDLLVDLHRTAFIDSTGLHALLNAQRRLVQQGRRLHVVCANGPVRRSIELARLTATLGVISSEREYPGRAAR
jgi:anti-sigma B factor antagonist